MKTPRLFRPLLAFGMVAIFVALLSFFTVPAWRSSPLALGLLLAVIVIGAAAIARDVAALSQEYKQMHNGDKRDKP